jgi:hypothetical protein
MQSIQDYCGPNWQIFFMDSHVFGESVPTKLSDLVFDPSDVDHLLTRSRAVVQATSNIVNGVLSFTHSSSLVSCRQNGLPVQNTMQDSIPLYSVAPTNVKAGGGRTQLTLAERLALLNDDNVGTSFPLNALPQTLVFDCIPNNIKFVEIEFGTQIPIFDIVTESVASGAMQHTKTLVGSSRYRIDNVRDDIKQVTLSFGQSQTIFEVRAIRFFTDQIIADSVAEFDYAILRPVSWNTAITGINAPAPYLLISCGGPMSNAELRTNRQTYKPNDIVSLMHLQLKPQILEI